MQKPTFKLPDKVKTPNFKEEWWGNRQSLVDVICEDLVGKERFRGIYLSKMTNSELREMYMKARGWNKGRDAQGAYFWKMFKEKNKEINEKLKAKQK